MKPTPRLEMPKSAALQHTLNRAVDEFQPEVVIETGTYLGTGSTRRLLDALDDHRPTRFCTIEVSGSLCAQARRNLAPWPFVEVLHGLSVKRDDALNAIQTDPLLRELDPNLDIFVDYLPDPAAGYLAELQGSMGGDQTEAPPDGLLVPLLERHANQRMLICLDSAGALGWLEFSTVMQHLGNRDFLLLLDDTNHIKHHRSRMAVRESSAFRVLGESLEEGWLVAAHTALR